MVHVLYHAVLFPRGSYIWLSRPQIFWRK